MLTWNIQGLGNPLYRSYESYHHQVIIEYLVRVSLDFLLLQEQMLSDNIPIWIPAFMKLGYVLVQKSWRGIYGYCQKWAPLIIQKQMVTLGRAQFIIVQEEEYSWGLLNVYAPNSGLSRKQFW